jgi:hypothetical protein
MSLKEPNGHPTRKSATLYLLLLSVKEWRDNKSVNNFKNTGIIFINYTHTVHLCGVLSPWNWEENANSFYVINISELLSVSENGTSIEIGGKEVSLLFCKSRKLDFNNYLYIISNIIFYIFLLNELIVQTNIHKYVSTYTCSWQKKVKLTPR